MGSYRKDATRNKGINISKSFIASNNASKGIILENDDLFNRHQLYLLAKQVVWDCYLSSKSAKEIIHDFLIGIERIRNGEANHV
ncbi:hypothetical protein [Legionella nagasakiensis]|uniref:hypothetical protein n=1 Tax=Legionella nagasakiensis TaxID=535290 RepID=UPI0010563561|nr:hypothetical protein [Legionella nagasakiensis]